MASNRPRRISDDQALKSSTGLLSHVFSFVSREFESFVLNATARPESQPAPTRRVKGSRRRRARDEERNMSEDEARYRSRTYHHRQRPDQPVQARPKPRSKSSDSRKLHHDRVRPTSPSDDRARLTGDRARSTSPVPPAATEFLVPPLPTLRKQPSFTMPGALFPRSPSLLPDGEHYIPATLSASTPAQLARPLYDVIPNRAEAGPSWGCPPTLTSADADDPTQPSLDDYVSPWRTRSVSSVKDAVHRFNATDGVEADFSLMLPSPHASPVRPVSRPHSADESSPHRLVADPVASSSSKGKARARDDADLEFIVGGGAGHDDGGVHAKERELDAARQAQRLHERRSSGDQSRRASDERERDKRRIRALEEEVRWLKEELSRSQARASPPPSVGAPVPPPPPPPPPPLPLRIDTAPSTPTFMFAAARASLRHAMTPVEAPINPLVQHKTKRTGQPTVNVPSEKMAAFLHEIKTAKLKKVGSGLNAMGGDGVAGPSGLSKSVCVAASSQADARERSLMALKRRRSLASLRVPIGSALAAPVPFSAMVAAKEAEVRAGQKRKADALGVEEATGAPAKRRMTESSSQSSSQSQDTPALPLSGTLTRSDLSLPTLTNETDVTTPSLCSDNDRDENSIEDQVPSTPPGPRSTVANGKLSKANPPEEQIEVIDVEMEERSRTEPEPVPRRTSDLFKKRPPMSPIPIPTPRRPSAPARTKRGATPKPKSFPSMESDDDAADEALPQPTPVPFLSLIPVTKPKPTKSKAKPTLTGKGRPRASLQQQNGRQSSSSGSGSKRRKTPKRRQTLDEELRTAEARSSDMDECNDELDPAEEDVFTATGTRSSRRGFLAHGGGGGAPVFMGVGYVEGAAVDSEDEDVVTGAQPRRPSKPASFIPRPKGRI